MQVSLLEVIRTWRRVIVCFELVFASKINFSFDVSSEGCEVGIVLSRVRSFFEILKLDLFTYDDSESLGFSQRKSSVGLILARPWIIVYFIFVLANPCHFSFQLRTKRFLNFISSGSQMGNVFNSLQLSRFSN